MERAHNAAISMPFQCHSIVHIDCVSFPFTYGHMCIYVYLYHEIIENYTVLLFQFILAQNIDVQTTVKCAENNL